MNTKTEYVLVAASIILALAGSGCLIAALFRRPSADSAASARSARFGLAAAALDGTAAILAAAAGAHETAWLWSMFALYAIIQAGSLRKRAAQQRRIEQRTAQADLASAQVQTERLAAEFGLKMPDSAPSPER